MFEVIIGVCLAATGADCREYKLAGKEYANVRTCITDSHAEAAAWQLQNNKYTIISTRCVKGAKVPEAPKS